MICWRVMQKGGDWRESCEEMLYVQGLRFKVQGGEETDFIHSTFVRLTIGFCGLKLGINQMTSSIK